MSDESITETLPPAELLESDMALIKAGIKCVDSVETVQTYAAYENAHQQRVPVLEQLHLRAEEIRSVKCEGDSIEESTMRPCL